MTLEVHETGLRRLGHKLRIEVLVARHEWDVHERAACGIGHRGVEELGCVKVVVEDLGLLGVPLVHGGKPAVLEQPLEHEAAHVDAPAVGRVVERALVGLCLEAQHRGDARKVVGDEVLANDDDLDPCWADVLLDARVDAAELGHVDRLREEHRTLVGDEHMALGVGQGVVLRTVDGVVLADVEVVRIIADGQVRAVGDVGEVLVRRACHDVGVTQDLRLLAGLLRPVARNHEVSLAVRGKVDEGGRKQERVATLQEEHLVVLGDAHEGADVRLGLVDDALEDL